MYASLRPTQHFLTSYVRGIKVKSFIVITAARGSPLVLDGSFISTKVTADYLHSLCLCLLIVSFPPNGTDWWQSNHPATARGALIEHLVCILWNPHNPSNKGTHSEWEERWRKCDFACLFVGNKCLGIFEMAAWVGCWQFVKWNIEGTSIFF